MKKHVVPSARQAGVAVVIALLLTTLAITIIASLFWQQQVQVRSIENQRLQLQKQWILRGALDWASLILREDAAHSSIDDLDEPWAVPLADTRLDQYVEEGRNNTEISDTTLSGSISDAQARYNLTNLCPDGNIDYAEVAVFERLLALARLDTTLAQATATAMAATFKKPASGNNGQPSRPRTIKLTQLDDVLAVPGFTQVMLDNLKDWVILLPRTTTINVNTAPAEVLAAMNGTLSLSDANTLVQTRNTASFRDLADFNNRLPGKSLSATLSKASVTTSYFLINGKIRMNRAGLDMQALIERTGNTVKLIWIREH